MLELSRSLYYKKTAEPGHCAFCIKSHNTHIHICVYFLLLKLAELGHLCGLMPDQETPTSDQLNTVVNLLSGMGKSSPATQVENSPNQKLREALSSTSAFQRQYLVKCTFSINFPQKKIVHFPLFGLDPSFSFPSTMKITLKAYTNNNKTNELIS